MRFIVSTALEAIFVINDLWNVLKCARTACVVSSTETELLPIFSSTEVSGTC